MSTHLIILKQIEGADMNGDGRVDLEEYSRILTNDFFKK